MLTLSNFLTFNIYFMLYFSETILPVLFIGLSTYFVGSVCRLFIHLLISESCK